MNKISLRSHAEFFFALEISVETESTERIQNLSEYVTKNLDVLSKNLKGKHTSNVTSTERAYKTISKSEAIPVENNNIQS